MIQINSWPTVPILGGIFCCTYSWTQNIQDVLNDPMIKVTEAKDVQWLSHVKAVNNLSHCHPLLLHLKKKPQSDMKPKLAEFMQKYNFTATLLIMCDILPHLANLLPALQCAQLQQATRENPMLSRVVRYTQSGWPEQMPNALKQFWRCCKRVTWKLYA